MLKGSDRIVMWKFAWPYLWIYRSFIMFKQYVVISHTLTKLMFKVEFLLFKKYYYNQLKNCLNNCEFLWNFGMSYNSNTHLFKSHQSHTLSKLGFSYILTREKVETNILKLFFTENHCWFTHLFPILRYFTGSVLLNMANNKYINPKN